MAGIPSREGSGGDARDRSIRVSELFTPFSASVMRFYHENKNLLGETLSGLSHLPTHEMMDALRKKLKEHSLSKAASVHTGEDDEDEDEVDEDEEDEDEDEDEDEVEKDEKDRDGGRMKLTDDEKKPRSAEEHQVYSECEKKA